MSQLSGSNRRRYRRGGMGIPLRLPANLVIGGWLRAEVPSCWFHLSLQDWNGMRSSIHIIQQPINWSYRKVKRSFGINAYLVDCSNRQRICNPKSTARETHWQPCPQRGNVALR